MSMCSINSTARCILSLWMFSMALFTGPVALAQLHVGEDGIEYQLDEATGSPDSASRRYWLREDDRMTLHVHSFK